MIGNSHARGSIPAAVLVLLFLGFSRCQEPPRPQNFFKFQELHMKDQGFFQSVGHFDDHRYYYTDDSGQDIERDTIEPYHYYATAATYFPMRFRDRSHIKESIRLKSKFAAGRHLFERSILECFRPGKMPFQTLYGLLKFSRSCSFEFKNASKKYHIVFGATEEKEREEPSVYLLIYQEVQEKFEILTFKYIGAVSETSGTDIRVSDDNYLFVLVHHQKIGNHGMSAIDTYIALPP